MEAFRSYPFYEEENGAQNLAQTESHFALLLALV